MSGRRTSEARASPSAASSASLEELGPGLITGAADDDPSGIATYSQAGAQFGYGLMWTMLLCYPLMSAVQLVSAHIGRVTGAGLANNLLSSFPKQFVGFLIAILLIANIINIGADLSAMAEAAQLVVGGGEHEFVIAFAIVSTLLQLFIPYRRYASILKWLTLSLFAYVAVLLVVRVDWSAALIGLVWPTNLGRDALLTIVALFGTTISPYLFFWQSSQEAEEIANSRHRPIKQEPRSARGSFGGCASIRWLAWLSPTSSHSRSSWPPPRPCTGRESPRSDRPPTPPQALRPVAGQFAFALFAIGIVGTGFLAVPVLAGSAAFAVAEIFGWKEGLEYQPRQAAGFYSIIVLATFIGVIIDWSPIDPMRALFWSAVLNGIAAVPLMIAMMIVISRHQVMGRFTRIEVVVDPWLGRDSRHGARLGRNARHCHLKDGTNLVPCALSGGCDASSTGSRQRPRRRPASR